MWSHPKRARYEISTEKTDRLKMAHESCKSQIAVLEMNGQSVPQRWTSMREGSNTARRQCNAWDVERSAIRRAKVTLKRTRSVTSSQCKTLRRMYVRPLLGLTSAICINRAQLMNWDFTRVDTNAYRPAYASRLARGYSSLASACSFVRANER